MKATDLNVALGHRERANILKSICSKLNLEAKIEHHKDEFSMAEIMFEGSMEGLTFALENNNSLNTYGKKLENFVEAGIMPKGWHFYINPWVYENMPKKELARMLKTTKELLKELPDAVLVFSDDGSLDYNVNSAVPEHTRNYTCKANKPNDWLKKFKFDE